MPADYSSTARALSLSPTPASPALGHPFTRPRTAARLSAGPRRGDPKSVSARLYDALVTTGQTLVRGYLVLSPRQRVLFIIATIISAIISVLFLIYSPRLFTALGPVAQSWRETPGGWLLIWLAVFGSAFPPLIGYSTVNTVAGFIYGFPNAWPLVATASTLGSLASFVASRTVLSGYVDRLVGKDPRFVALGQVLRKEGLGMLTMIRFCPLPYSLSNGFLATIPSIGPLAFAVSTAFARLASSSPASLIPLPLILTLRQSEAPRPRLHRLPHRSPGGGRRFHVRLDEGPELYLHDRERRRWHCRRVAHLPPHHGARRGDRTGECGGGGPRVAKGS